MRGLLVVAEVGLAVLLLIGAGLLTRSLFNLLDWRPGFELDHAMVAFMTAPLDKYPTGKQVAKVFRQSIAETAAVPGVTAAGAASGGPLFGGGDGQVRFLIDGRTPPPSTLDYPRANRGDILRLVLGQGMLPVMAGLTLGLGGARLAAPLLGNLLVAVDPADFVSFGAAALVLAGASLLGCYLPARRLHRLDPAATLRRRGN